MNAEVLVSRAIGDIWEQLFDTRRSSACLCWGRFPLLRNRLGANAATAAKAALTTVLQIPQTYARSESNCWLPALDLTVTEFPSESVTVRLTFSST